jgi:hypothetical protein
MVKLLTLRDRVQAHRHYVKHAGMEDSDETTPPVRHSGRLHLDAIRNSFELSSNGVGKDMSARAALWHHFKLSGTWWGARHF